MDIHNIENNLIVDIFYNNLLYHFYYHFIFYILFIPAGFGVLYKTKFIRNKIANIFSNENILCEECPY